MSRAAVPFGMPPRASRWLLALAFPAFAGPLSAQLAEARSHDSVTTADVRCSSCVGIRPLALGEKADLYVDQTLSIKALLGASYAAGIAQWRHTPREWGSGIGGYGRRAAAAYGGSLTRHTTEFAVGSLLHEDPRFEPSARNGFVLRTEDALYHAAMVRNDDGGRQLAMSRIAASLATGLAVNSWEPRKLRSTHHAFMLSLAGVASYATGTVMREFTPDVKRYLFARLHIRDRL